MCSYIIVCLAASLVVFQRYPFNKRLSSMESLGHFIMDNLIKCLAEDRNVFFFIYEQISGPNAVLIYFFSLVVTECIVSDCWSLRIGSKSRNEDYENAQRNPEGIRWRSRAAINQGKRVQSYCSKATDLFNDALLYTRYKYETRDFFFDSISYLFIGLFR